MNIPQVNAGAMDDFEIFLFVFAIAWLLLTLSSRRSGVVENVYRPRPLGAKVGDIIKTERYEPPQGGTGAMQPKKVIVVEHTLNGPQKTGEQD